MSGCRLGCDPSETCRGESSLASFQLLVVASRLWHCSAGSCSSAVPALISRAVFPGVAVLVTLPL